MIKLSNGITERTIHWMCVNLPLEPTVDYIYHVGLMCCWVPWQKAADMVTPSPLRTGAGISKEYTAFPVGLPIIMASKEINCNSVIAPSLLPLTGPQKYFFSLFLKPFPASGPLHLLWPLLGNSVGFTLPVPHQHSVQLRCHFPQDSSLHALPKDNFLATLHPSPHITIFL